MQVNGMKQCFSDLQAKGLYKRVEKTFSNTS